MVRGAGDVVVSSVKRVPETAYDFITRHETVMSELHAPLIHADVIPQKRIESLQFDAQINGARFVTFKVRVSVNEITTSHIYSV